MEPDDRKITLQNLPVVDIVDPEDGGGVSEAERVIIKTEDSVIIPPVTRQQTPMVFPMEEVRAATPPPAEDEAEVDERKLETQLSTFRLKKEIKTKPGFHYHGSDEKGPTPLHFEEIENESFVRMKLRAVDDVSKPKVDELFKMIRAGWNVEGAPRITRKRGAVFESWVYFLKYRRLEQRDRECLELVRQISLKGGVCFIFVDETFARMDKVKANLSKANLLPPGVVLLPWEEHISADQKKCIMGLTVAAKFEDMTQSMRSVSRVLIPGTRKYREW